MGSRKKVPVNCAGCTFVMEHFGKVEQNINFHREEQEKAWKMQHEINNELSGQIKKLFLAAVTLLASALGFLITTIVTYVIKKLG